VTVEQPKAAPAKINQVAYGAAPWTKALQRILELEDGIGSNFVEPGARQLNLPINCKPLVTVPMNTTVT